MNGCFRILPLSAFGPHPRYKDGLEAMCRECVLVRVQISRHGLTGADKAAMADAQEGCGICGRPEPGKKGWVVDHDRSCCSGDRSCESCRRAILCGWCNTALGYAQDDPQILRRMADYLELGTRIGPIADPNRNPTRDPTNLRTRRTDVEVGSDNSHLTFRDARAKAKR